MRIGQASEHVGEPGLRVDIVRWRFVVARYHSPQIDL
jgi:hypothetical protein